LILKGKFVGGGRTNHEKSEFIGNDFNLFVPGYPASDQIPGGGPGLVGNCK
jgi:hypothetical protein